jgi:hypothetical protein
VAQLLGLADAVHDGLTGLAFLAAAGAHPTKDEVADHLRGYVAETSTGTVGGRRRQLRTADLLRARRSSDGPPASRLCEVELGELASGGDPGLGEDVPQVERDGAG